MSGVELKIDSEEIKIMLGKAAKAIDGDILPRKAAHIVAESIRYNFVAGGRPQKWAVPKYRRGQPLRDTGRLLNSISSTVSGGVGVVSTNVVYAATHNYGAKKGQFGTKAVTVKAHSRKSRGGISTVKSHKRRQSLPWGDIPQREFFLVQPEDVKKIEAMAKKEIEK